MVDPSHDPLRPHHIGHISPNINSLSDSNSILKENEELKNQAEQLHAFIGYSAHFPKNHQKTFQALSIIMCLAESNLLTLHEQKRAITEISSIKDSLYAGEITISMPHFHDNLQRVLLHIQDHNPKAKVFSLALEIEYLLTIHVPNDLPSIGEKECEKLLKPFKTLIFDPNIPSFYLLTIAKNLEQTKDAIITNPNNRSLYLDYLEKYGTSF